MVETLWNRQSELSHRSWQFRWPKWVFRHLLPDSLSAWQTKMPADSLSVSLSLFFFFLSFLMLQAFAVNAVVGVASGLLCSSELCFGACLTWILHSPACLWFAELIYLSGGGRPDSGEARAAGGCWRAQHRASEACEVSCALLSFLNGSVLGWAGLSLSSKTRIRAFVLRVPAMARQQWEGRRRPRSGLGRLRCQSLATGAKEQLLPKQWHSRGGAGSLPASTHGHLAAAPGQKHPAKPWAGGLPSIQAPAVGSQVTSSCGCE